MTADPNQNKEETPQESMAERSARMEAEAEAMAKGDMAREQELEDSLAPEPEETYDIAEGDGEIEALQEELAQAKDQMMRALADAENTRRRAVKEREHAGKYAVTGFAKDMLGVADNLRRAIEAIPDDLKSADPRIEGVIGGIEATERELLKSFEKNGIAKLSPLDQPFDPNFHEVMFEAPVPGKKPGTVMQVVETGYTLNNRLLRPARVGIVKDDGSAGGDGGTPDTPHIDTEV